MSFNNKVLQQNLIHEHDVPLPPYFKIKNFIYLTPGLFSGYNCQKSLTFL